MKLADFYSQTNKDSIIPVSPFDEISPNGGFCGIFRRIVVIGDSLASGEMQTAPGLCPNNYHDYYDYSWGAYMGRLIGSEVKIFGKGGMTARQYCEEFADQYGYWDARHAAQAYIIGLGHNDIANKLCEPGSPSDIDLKDWHNNKKTFCGYLGQIIQRYKELEPHARFFIFTDPADCPDDIEREAKFDLHAKLVREIAAMFDYTYVLDFRHYIKYDQEFQDNFYKLKHMNPAGYLLVSRMVASYIDHIIRSDFDAFKQVALIGSPAYDESLDKKR